MVDTATSFHGMTRPITDQWETLPPMSTPRSIRVLQSWAVNSMQLEERVMDPLI